MQKIGNITSTADANGEWTGGNVAAGTPPTIIDAAWLNTIQRELAGLVAAAGLALDPQNDAQVLAALKKLFFQTGNNLSEISSAGAAAQLAAVQNLGLASGAPPIGIPFYWPSAQLPNAVMTEWSNMVFLKWNGATFSAATYPKLALVVPSLRLTDVRGEFIRVFDDGRGVDSGRTLLSAQSDAIRNITGQIGYVQFFGDTTVSGALYGGGSQNLTNLAPGTSTISQSIFFDASKSVATANENRPRNIAFNFLVRAA